MHDLIYHIYVTHVTQWNMLYAITVAKYHYIVFHLISTRTLQLFFPTQKERKEKNGGINIVLYKLKPASPVTNSSINSNIEGPFCMFNNGSCFFAKRIIPKQLLVLTILLWSSPYKNLNLANSKPNMNLHILVHDRSGPGPPHWPITHKY